ncbi:MAG: 2-amino-4-hydroxy-6-hydroxymethyldihydropteridine diphosphokinase [Deltaproteobacteria bacterium]|nr:MAG: 2-amino-4-hydroxy-6-hydroxymethyldihydropteridine diphosphokinase [Deltaproteobacteria bacterium]
MEATCLSLGSNLGDSARNILLALGMLRDSGTRPVMVSRLYLTEPQGKTDQPDFYNIAATVETSLEPKELLELCLEVERRLGRVRTARWGPRVIDIDIVLAGKTVINMPGLVVPHPRMHRRRFVLEPLCELVPNEVHPVLGKTMSELLEDPSVRAQPVTPLGPLPGWNG